MNLLIFQRGLMLVIAVVPSNVEPKVRKGKRNMIVSTSTDAPKCKKSTPIPMIKTKRCPSRLRGLNRMASTDHSVEETSQADKQESSVVYQLAVTGQQDLPKVAPIQVLHLRLLHLCKTMTTVEVRQIAKVTPLYNQ